MKLMKLVYVVALSRISTNEALASKVEHDETHFYYQ